MDDSRRTAYLARTKKYCVDPTELPIMRTETRMPIEIRGQITETLAKAVLDIVKKQNAYLVDSGYLAPIILELEERLIDRLTNTPNVNILFAQCRV